jgi:hypothetical protein
LISSSNAMSETKQEYQTLNFLDKNAEKFSIPSPEGNNAVRIMTIHKSVGISCGNHAFCREKIIVKQR